MCVASFVASSMGGCPAQLVPNSFHAVHIIDLGSGQESGLQFHSLN
jgi:hypothetical protein